MRGDLRGRGAHGPSSSRRGEGPRGGGVFPLRGRSPRPRPRSASSPLVPRPRAAPSLPEPCQHLPLREPSPPCPAAPRPDPWVCLPLASFPGSPVPASPCSSSHCLCHGPALGLSFPACGWLACRHETRGQGWALGPPLWGRWGLRPWGSPSQAQPGCVQGGSGRGLPEPPNLPTGRSQHQALQPGEPRAAAGGTGRLRAGLAGR